MAVPAIHLRVLTRQFKRRFTVVKTHGICNRFPARCSGLSIQQCFTTLPIGEGNVPTGGSMAGRAVHFQVCAVWRLSQYTGGQCHKP